ncbi:MAG: arginyl-tRNA synthetase [Osedax symbiont Rs1]|nr:MAG: arginyl-tRNA synthetase [Osedax symbiont Rs1]
MKQHITGLIQAALDTLVQNGSLPKGISPSIMVENTRDKSHGDLASNIAMTLAKPARRNPREIATLITQALPASDILSKTEIAGPGFINFFITSASATKVLEDIFEQTTEFGCSTELSAEKIQVEFVSANPTGPLHVGHGRGAAYGATVADILAANGAQVSREYYVNDAGRQMDILAVSVWLRYLEQCGASFVFPANAYKGQYVYDIAEQVKAQYSDKFSFSSEQVFAELPLDEPQGGDKERYIDAVIARCRQLLGETAFQELFQVGLTAIRDDIRDDLSGFGIDYQEWFSERSLTSTGDVDKALNRLQENGNLYEKEGNIWFKSTDFGDDKDRVVKRANGATTYFASDIAYHMNKFDRGFDKVVNIWGADHHGYITRVKAAIQALGYDPQRLTVKLVQFAILYRGSERVQMSTRSGSFVTLRELRGEVGKDACRFFYVTRKADNHMDFDLELAKSQSKDNPVYYIQYAHARICSVLSKLNDSEWQLDLATGLRVLGDSTDDAEKALLNQLARYPETIKNAATNYEPHLVANYLKELASEFHTYYNSNKMLIEDAELRNARITLSTGVKQVLANGLSLLGVDAPQRM